ncbi:transcription factor [Candidatus Bathyarchaeota archaeon]|nr:transcription factor [Candidatus Bathyarchaeota archaeon]MBS7613391.1 transcription factor [Candidatus Bathyarchaeota archaeon]MBS7617117.1 transcription factor [Candidatus Bathyarchaeota archaeon]
MSKRENLLYRLAEVVAGGDGIKVIKCLIDNGSMRDDELALALGLKPNVVRRILYQFAENSIVTVQRFRDEKTGWYYFKWMVQPDQVELYLEDQRRKLLRRLKERLQYEKSHEFYSCPKGCLRLTFEEAVEKNFTCSGCGASLQYDDNKKVISRLEVKIRELSEERH